jgi:hypothetical protein
MTAERTCVGVELRDPAVSELVRHEVEERVRSLDCNACLRSQVDAERDARADNGE